MPSNRSCRMSIVACGVWHVAPSCWNHILSVSISSILGHKKLLIIDLLSSLAVDDYGNARFVLEEIWTDDSARPKSAPNSDFLGMHLKLVISRELVSSQTTTILLVHISIHPKMGLIAKDDLFGEICLLISNCSRTQSANTALSMVVYLKFLSQLNFIGVQTQVPTQNSPS